MAFTKEITYKVVTPKSEADSAYTEHEFLLAWYGRNGAYYQKMFTDWDNDQKFSGDTINNYDPDTLENIPESEDRTATLYAENLNRNDFVIISSIFVAKMIERIYKDGTRERVGIVLKTITHKQSGGRYNLQFDIKLYNKNVPT